jgi:hypothetical protein
MARLQFITARERDLGAGIDQQSAENQLVEGYCEDIENADPKSTGQIAKRTGYQGYAGYLPIRVKEVEYAGTQIDFILDESIELPTGQSSPIIVQGQTSVASGDFASETILYFDAFTADIRKTFSTGSGTATLAQSEHGHSTPLLFVGTARNTSETNDNEHFFPDNISINTSTYDVSVDYTNNTGAAFSGFIYASDKSASTGTTYVQSGNTIAIGANSFTILGATHLLDTNNILAEVYRDTGTSYVRVQADQVTLDSGTGDLTIDLTNNTGASFTAVFILTAAPAANFATGSVASGGSESITIDTTVDGGTDFAFVACYLEPSIGADFEQVIPDSISTDSDAGTITVTFTNNKATGANFEIYWDFATVVTNQLSVTGTASATFTDTTPQLTIWGLCHEEIYGTRTAREGWVSHIDSYRAPGENRLISGLGGNLFAARLQSEGTNSTDYLMPTHYPRLNGRIASDTIIGPAFYETGETPNRTRGFITGDNDGTNYFEITDIAYNSGTGYVDYTLTVPNMVISGTLSTIISTTADLEDEFTTQQCGHSLHNGTFTIKAVAAPTATTLQISVENSNIDTSDYDETDVGGYGGIFTDQLVLSTTSPFLVGDEIISDLFDTADDFICAGTSGTTTVLRGLDDALSLPGGLRLAGIRTDYIIPLRDLSNTSTVENLVRGDILNYTGLNRQLRIKSINQLTDISISITGDGIDTATVTLGSGDTTTLFIGKKLLLSGTSSYNGTITVERVLDTTTFTFTSTAATTEAGTLVGKTIEIDENLQFQDTTDSSVSLEVDARWIPIESPTNSYDLTPSTRISYFDSSAYASQNIIRSTMVQDNLYLTNSTDEVMKFDGTNIYRAGLFRWQPNFFVATDTSATGKIVMDNPSVSFTAISANRFTVAAGDEKTFATGDRIEASTDNEIYTVISTETSGQIIVDRSISGGASGTITRTRTFQYYFRLNAVDANENVIASAVAGSEDFTIRLGADAAVNIKLIGMPAWDIYDYDKLEVQIYRTVGDSPAPFYRLTTLAMSFNNDDGYLEFTDTDSDEDLRDLDEVNTALKGAELGTAWEQPLRAKYCTTAGNRLILGNLKDYPTMDIRVLKNSGILTQSVFTDASNKFWRFRKDNTDTATTTDMLNRVRYEFTSTTSTVVGITGTAGTSFSVNVTGHGLTAGDWVYLFHSAVTDGNLLTYSGWWQVNSITDVNNFVILSSGSGSGAATNFPDKMVKSTAGVDVPVYIGTDGNYSMVNGNRGSSEPYEFLAMRRLSDAINASMRKVDITVSGYETFSPWMIGNAGNEFNTGQLVVRQPRVFDTTLEVELPTLTGAFDVFVNNVRRDGADQASALTRLYPSRIIASYQNYPEIFDNPTSVIDTESDSVIDVNSADGQEITAIIPFFGDAAFGAAQKSSIIVVFKTNSIYLVDLSAKDAGTSAVQRLETRGKGCTAPYSVSVTRGGIIFANDTGIYRLGRGLKVEYIGRKYERKWQETVASGQLEIATGHHDTGANSYKLSYPTTGDTENSEVAVYNHTREYEGKGEGSWTTYTNHPATGWTNLNANSYFASTDGRVYIIRKLGETSDYRDDDQAIAMSILTRAMDMLESGQRKVFSKIITHYRALADTEGTSLEAALDLETTFQSTDTFKITKETTSANTGNTSQQKVMTITSVIDSKVGVYLQLKYSNSSLDEPVEIAGIDIRVAAKGSEGIKEAAETV